MRSLIALLGLVAAAGLFAVDNEWLRLVQERRWAESRALFADGSGRVLEERFGAAQAVALNAAGSDRYTYFAKFPDRAEIGTLSLKAADGRLADLRLTPIVSGMGFISAFAHYPVSGLSLVVGDARLELQEGTLYQALPLRGLFLFSGSWRLQVSPGDAEEQATLRGLLRRDSFVIQGQTVLLALSDESFLAKLPPPVVAPLPESADSQYLMGLFRAEFGCPAAGFGETWFYPFYRDLNLFLFRNDRRSFFKYSFNRNLSPDTSLVLMPSNRFYLHYNSIQRPKLSLASPEELERLTANLYFNPDSGLLSATTQIRFREPSNLKTLNLAAGLQVRECSGEAGEAVAFFRSAESLYLTGNDIRKVNVYYAGRFDSEMEGERGPESHIRHEDSLLFLKRDAGFIPNPGLSFYSSRITVSLPSAYACLAPGRLVETRRLGNRAVFRFESPGSKGVDVVCGEFKPVGEVRGLIPIRLYSTSGRFFENAMPREKIRRFGDFLVSRYGAPPSGELSILFRRWRDFGGQSFEGFVVFNMVDMRGNWTESTSRRVQRDSPVVMTDVISDSLLHELAHQWWGGQISWRTYRDVWLTEGLATFSTLAYWRENLPPEKFREVLERLRRWVLRNFEVGPILYGQRIANLVGDYDAYQSVVYSKTALVIQMLSDIIGPDALFARLRDGLANHRFQSISSGQFIRLLADGPQQALLERFLQGWLQSRALPRVSWRVLNDADGVRLQVSQADTDMVFPLELQIGKPGGPLRRVLVVERRVQEFPLPEWQAGELLQLNPLSTPLLALERDR